jgi:putative sugar O-methyltransferase
VGASDVCYRAGGLYDGAIRAGGTWSALAGPRARQYLTPQGVDATALARFRETGLFVLEEPPWAPTGWSLRRLLDHNRAAILRGLNRLCDALEGAGHRDLMIKYPPSPVGNPHVFRRGEIALTMRHGRALRNLALYEAHVRPVLHKDRVVVVDIGGAYGIFVELVRRAHPTDAAIVVDFAEQLVLAEAYLREAHPDARVLTAREYGDLSTWSPEGLRTYDFVLVPVQHAASLPAGAADVVANFVSFSEMSRDAFASYLATPVYRGAKILLTVNRFSAYPHQTGITIVDYPVWDAGRRIHLGVSPVVLPPIVRVFGPLHQILTHAPDQFFEYVGWI